MLVLAAQGAVAFTTKTRLFSEAKLLGVSPRTPHSISDLHNRERGVTRNPPHTPLFFPRLLQLFVGMRLSVAGRACDVKVDSSSSSLSLQRMSWRCSFYKSSQARRCFFFFSFVRAAAVSAGGVVSILGPGPRNNVANHKGERDQCCCCW